MDFNEALENDADPRITGEYIRNVPDNALGNEPSIVLVGVVHDHPASTHRVRWAVENLDADVLALELPRLAVPLFEEYARSDRQPPPFGGEMSAAIQAAASARVTGIDRPSGRFFRGLLERLVRKRPPPGTVRHVLSNVVSTTKHAVVCRLAAVLAARTSLRLEVDVPVAHKASISDTADEQARDERAQVRKSRAFMSAFPTASPARASQLEDASRERHMADQLSKLRAEGDVVAVVGIHHLEPLFERLVRTAEPISSNRTNG